MCRISLGQALGAPVDCEGALVVRLGDKFGLRFVEVWLLPTLGAIEVVGQIVYGVTALSRLSPFLRRLLLGENN